MKLCYSPKSPFVRKVMVCAMELGIRDQIEPVADDASNIFVGINPSTPLGKVPSLTLDNGQVLYDSVVICEYLDGLSDKAQLFPTDLAERARVLTQHAMADGMTDAAYQRRMDSVMPEDEGSPSWNARLKVAMEKCLDEMERQADTYGNQVNIGIIAIACALGYHDFRFSAETWRSGRPRLAAWYDEFAKRPSMVDTMPPEDG